MKARTYTLFHGSRNPKAIRKEGFKLGEYTIRNIEGKKQRLYQMGVHLTKEKKDALPYAKGNGLITAKAKVKAIPEKEYWKIYNRLIKEGYKKPGTRFESGRYYAGNRFMRELKRRILKKGYNAVSGREMIIFNPRSIKIINKR